MEKYQLMNTVKPGVKNEINYRKARVKLDSFAKGFGTALKYSK